MEKVIMRLIAVSAVVVAMLAFAADPASAHEERDVGTYVFAVGFGQEPAYAGQPNSVQLLLHQNGKPVNDLYAYTDALYAQRPGDTVDVVVMRGTERVTVKVTLGRRN